MRTLGLTIMIFGLSQVAQAQTVTGSIRGTAADTQNAVVAGATVKLTNPLTSQSLEYTTDINGTFVFPDLVRAIIPFASPSPASVYRMPRRRVFTPSGKFSRMIEFPETPANCAFGGHDLQTLYVTARTSVYSVRIPDKGSLPS